MRISVKKAVIAVIAGMSVMVAGFVSPVNVPFSHAATETTATETTTPAEPTVPQCRGANDQWLKVSQGSLDWGVLESFVNYIRNFAHGSWELDGGATWNEENKQFNFPYKAGYFDVTKHFLVVEYSGTVHFTAHSGALDLTITDPTIVAQRGGDSYLYAAMKSKSMSSGEVVDYGRIPVANLSKLTHALEDNSVDLTGADVKLTAQGVPAFGGFYKEGKELGAVHSLFTTAQMDVCATAEPTPSTPEATPENPHIVTEPVVPECSENAPMMSVTNGALNWGVRKSFTKYIKNFAGGSIDLYDGVQWNESTKEFSFPVKAGYYEMTNHKTVIQYSGAVHFTGHGGALDMWLVNPTLVVDPQAGSKIIVSMPENNTAEALAQAPRFVLATVGQLDGPQIDGAQVSLDGSGVAFTSTGVSAFGGFYASDPHMDSFQTTVTMKPMSACGADATIEIAVAPAPVEPPFTDVASTDAFAGEISWMRQAEITTGYPDGSFHPMGHVSREAMAAFLYRAAGYPEVVVDGVPFSDVPANNQFLKEITWMKQAEITTGYPDGSFHPYESVSREAMAAFLYRFCNSVEGGCSEAVRGAVEMTSADEPFVDVPENSPFFTEINWMRNAKVSTGWDDNTYRPYEPIARNAMAAFLYRIKHNTKN